MSNHKTQAMPLAQERWRRWEMDTFQAEESIWEPPPEPEPTRDLLDTAHLQELEKQAQLQGHETGYALGYAEGLDTGTAAGTEEGYKAGYQQGVADGYTAGYSHGQSTAQTEADTLRTLASDFAHHLSTIEQDIGQGLIGLAIGLAEHVLHDTIARHPESLLAVVKDITQQHSDNDMVLMIHAHPDDHALLQTYLSSDSCVKHWRLVPDPQIDRGGCIVNTSLGTIDATLPTRWRRAVTALGFPATLQE